MPPTLAVRKHAPAMKGTCQLMLRPVPCPTRMDSRPRPLSSISSLMYVAIMSMASSHVMRSHLFSPRSPARFMGYFRRWSLSTISIMSRQRMHSLPLA